MARIAILGAGMMGTALAWPLVDRGHAVRLIGTHLDREIIDSIARTRRHPGLDLTIPDPIEAFPIDALGRALSDADGVVLGVSSAGVRWAGHALRPHRCLPILMVSKGLEWNQSELRVLPDVLLDALGSEPHPTDPVAIAGPCIAGELARRVATSVLFAGRDSATNQRWAEWIRGPYYRVWTTEDLIGAEVCAAMKNAYAMGVALASGIHESRGGTPGSIAQHNYEASVFAQSIWEMQKIIALLGGNPAVAAGLAGVGDLNVTCNGGRTGRFGQALGRGIGLDAAIASMQGATLECLEILRTFEDALRDWRARGHLAPNALPLLEQLIRVGLKDAPIQMPFDQFFAP